MAVTNYEDIIDSRDIIERIEELSGFDTRDADEQRELDALEALQNEAEGYAPDWKYGAALVRDSYFETYARELAEELTTGGVVLNWPYTCIDWAEAARELKMDYTELEFDGVSYWVR